MRVNSPECQRMLDGVDRRGDTAVFSRVTSSDAGQRFAGAAVLANRGLPLQGYSANAEPAQRDAASAKIAQWWQSSSGELGTGFPHSPEDLAFAAK